MARLLLGVAAALLVAAAQGQQVTLRGGVFKGETLDAGGGRRVFSFRGIPYAKPPVGPLRFKDPEPLGPWEGVKESFDPPYCTQLDMPRLFKGEVNVIGDEDCLYLHVYTPQLCGAELLPVMVYIYGGGFSMGHPDEDGGSPLPLLTRDVVLVGPQYRLGKLGFLSTGDGVIPGNMGLKDQTLALRWVQDNIRSFGGDPERVTIFGISAGAASVHFQILTPKAQGLFHRAIMQSGSAIGPWATRMDDPIRGAASVARQVECTAVEEDGKVDSEALLTCLQGVPAEALVLSLIEGESWSNFSFHMVPRVDGDYLPAHPAQLLREGRYNKVDIMSGVCRDDGAPFAFDVSHADDLLYLFKKKSYPKPLERRDDLFLREIILDLWTNFAATGNPTPDLSLGFRWAPVTPSNLHYLSITPAATMRPDLRAQRRAFLTDLPTRTNKMLFPEKFAAASVARETREAAEGTCHA